MNESPRMLHIMTTTPLLLRQMLQEGRPLGQVHSDCIYHLIYSCTHLTTAFRLSSKSTLSTCMFQTVYCYDLNQQHSAQCTMHRSFNG